MNPFQIEFRLRQHTPIIHFQHDQTGATLRATELKPKLDRFIMGQLLGEKGIPFDDFRMIKGKRQFVTVQAAFLRAATGADAPSVPFWRNWLMGKGNAEHAALDYKVRIIAPKAERMIICNNLKRDQQAVLKNEGIAFLSGTPYFAMEKEVGQLFELGNEWDERQGREVPRAVGLKEGALDTFPRWGLMVELRGERTFKVEITSSHAGLLSLISRLFPAFLACENFGTRQSKGFGSFSVIEDPAGRAFGQQEFESFLCSQYKFVYRKSVANRDGLPLQRVFEEIQKDYKLLKSGRNPNERPPYVKSKLFLYAVSRAKPIRWEKRKIKQDIHASPPSLSVGGLSGTVTLKGGNAPVADSNGSGSWQDPSSPFDYRYLRSVLGLAEQLEFLSDFNGTSPVRGKIPKVKAVVGISSRNGLDRYKSPLLFKVYENHFYLVGNDVNPRLLSTSGNTKYFDFKLKLKVDEKLRDSPSHSLTPLMTPETFDLAEFVAFALGNKQDEKISGYRRLKPGPEQNM